MCSKKIIFNFIVGFSTLLLTHASAIGSTWKSLDEEMDGVEEGKTPSSPRSKPDPFEAYSVTLEKFSARKKYGLSVQDLRLLLSAKRSESGEVLAQRKKILYKIGIIRTEKLKPNDIKDKDQIVPLLDSRSTTSFEIEEIPYIVMRDGDIALSFRLTVNAQSKQDFIESQKYKRKVSQSLNKPKEMLKLQAKEFADLLPSHFKRHLAVGEKLVADFNPLNIRKVPMSIFEAFLKETLGSSMGSIYKKSLLIDGGHILTFSSKTLCHLSMIEPSDLLSYVGYSLEKRKRRNGKDAKVSLTLHYDLFRQSITSPEVTDKDGSKHPNLENIHSFDFSMKRVEDLPDTPQSEPSLLPMSMIQKPQRKLKIEEGRVRSRSFASTGEGIDFSALINEDTLPSTISGLLLEQFETQQFQGSGVKKTSSKFSQNNDGKDISGDEGYGSDDEKVATSSATPSMMPPKPIKPQIAYKRAKTVLNFAQLPSDNPSNHNGTEGTVKSVMHMVQELNLRSNAHTSADSPVSPRIKMISPGRRPMVTEVFGEPKDASSHDNPSEEKKEKDQ
ncbi:MAG: hypothetical protein ACTHJ4_01295 [Candidatus Nucleicultricaceae bacterium]